MIRRRLLVVDDSATYREALAERLDAAGYVVATAESGVEALRIASRQRPALMVIDGLMPDMDGTTLIRRIRLDSNLRTIPCILLTGSDDHDAELRALDAGADAFVRKEVEPDVIIARVAAVLRAAPEERSSPVMVAPAPRRLLAVDDDIDYLAMIGDALGGFGYEVVRASTSADALEQLARAQFDCILLDRTMPDRSGLDTCRQIKAAPVIRDTPLIMITGHAGRDATIEALSSGADDFIVKTSELPVLAARVQAQIRRKLFEDEHRRLREQLLRSELAAAEARAARETAEARARFAETLAATNRELEAANRNLEAFSYSVSHDLRAPLRTIGAFTQALAEDLADRLDDNARDHVRRVLAATSRMSDLIDALLELARIHRTPLARRAVDVSAVATAVVDELRRREPARDVEVVIAPGLVASGDERMIRIILDNLIGNAWKFTAKRERARIEIGQEPWHDTPALFVRDNGAGFDPSRGERMFTAFHRLHSTTEYPGTGIGLATVGRIIERHGGRVWATGAVGEGAVFHFTLSAQASAPAPAQVTH